MWCMTCGRSGGLQVFVVNFKAPAPPTQAAFFFFATEMMNPCMWSTDFDFKQAPYVPGNGLRSATCSGCAVGSPLCGPNPQPWCGAATIFAHAITAPADASAGCSHQGACGFPCRQAHKGFLRAFASVTNTSDARYDIAATWSEMTGVPAMDVTS